MVGIPAFYSKFLFWFYSHFKLNFLKPTSFSFGYDYYASARMVASQLNRQIIVLLKRSIIIDTDRDGHEISHFGGLPRQLYFPEVRSTDIVPRENITVLAPPTRDISSVPVDICYIRWSKWMISSKFYVLYDYHEVW